MVATSTVLVGCDKVKGLVGGKPSGQVLATVGGEEITALELRAEMAGFNSRDPKVMKQAQQQALQQIIMRKLVAQKAKEDKLDKSQDYALQVMRGEDALLTQLYQRKIATSLPTPNRTEAETYVANHPENFANRKVLTVDQVIAAPGKIDPERYKPINTLEGVKALLDGEGVPYQENVAVIDSLSTDPRMMAQLDKLPPNEVFVIPQQGVLVFNHVSAARTVPFRGDLAVKYALNQLSQQRAREAVVKRMQTLRSDAESKIVYNEAYKPQTPAAKGAATKAK